VDAWRGTYDPAMRDARIPSLAALWGLAIAGLSAALAAAAGPPYLSAAHVNAWIVVFAAALFAALFAAPFLIEHRLRERIPESDDRWERTMLYWGAGTAIVLIAALLLGAAGGFSGDVWAGSIGLIAAIEAGLVLGTLGAWVLSG
jgi:hypothetical protein